MTLRETLLALSVKALDAVEAEIYSLDYYFRGPLAPYHIGRLHAMLRDVRESANSGDWFGEFELVLQKLYDEMPEDRKQECNHWSK